MRPEDVLIFDFVFKVLEQALQKLKALPEERQRAAAEALELIAAQADAEPLTASEIEVVKRAQAAVRNGEHVTAVNAVQNTSHLVGRVIEF